MQNLLRGDRSRTTHLSMVSDGGSGFHAARAIRDDGQSLSNFLQYVGSLAMKKLGFLIFSLIVLFSFLATDDSPF